MYSIKLNQLIEFARADITDRVKNAAFTGLEVLLKNEAANHCCVRCESAEFFLSWRTLPDDPDGDREWVPKLGRCLRGMSLTLDPDGGLLMPTPAVPYCTAMAVDDRERT